MSADFNTRIELKGKKEDIQKAVNVIRKYADPKNDVHFDAWEFDADEVMKNFKKRELVLQFGGPYGRFGMLEDLTIPEEIAKAAPEISFDYKTYGFSTGADESIEAIYKNHKLTRNDFNMPYECKSEDYMKMIKKEKLPFKKVKETVKISKAAYEDFLNILEEFEWEIDDMSADDVRESCSTWIKVNDETFEKLADLYRNAGIVPYDDYDNSDAYVTTVVRNI